MRNSGTYTAKRRVSSSEWRGNSTRDFGGSENFGSFAGFSRNRNTVKITGIGKIGPMTLVAIFVMQVLIFGLLFVMQSAKATSYDYELSAIESQIEELEAQKEDLAVERARLTSIANSNTSTVAAAMENAEPSGYAE